MEQIYGDFETLTGFMIVHFLLRIQISDIQPVYQIAQQIILTIIDLGGLQNVSGS